MSEWQTIWRLYFTFTLSFSSLLSILSSQVSYINVHQAITSIKIIIQLRDFIKYLPQLYQEDNPDIKRAIIIDVLAVQFGGNTKQYFNSRHNSKNNHHRTVQPHKRHCTQKWSTYNHRFFVAMQ